MTEYSNDREEYENTEERNRSEKGENPFMFVIFLLLVGAFAYFLLQRSQNVRVDKSAEVENYIMSVRSRMFEDFNPVGITKSGRCIVSFEIDEQGNIINQQMLERSGVAVLDRKVLNSLHSIENVEIPPRGFKYGKPIKLEFKCAADSYQAECYSKNIVEKTK